MTGRFAPSPSGPLHAGSLLAALGSYIDARQRNGKWLLRIDDLDPERSSATATQDIIDCLGAHQLHHDGPVLYASDRSELYSAQLDALWAGAEVYACCCTRAVLRSTAGRIGHTRYPGTCSNLNLQRRGHAARLRVARRAVQWHTLSGDVCGETPAETTGDFVLQRRDGVYAYQLAVVVDDHLDEVTSVVRGADLEDNTGRQVYLQAVLGLRTPTYLHLPLVTAPDGRKLSKSNGAKPVDPTRPIENLLEAWSGLRQSPPPGRPESAEQFLEWASRNWNAQRAHHGL